VPVTEPAALNNGPDSTAAEPRGDFWAELGAPERTALRSAGTWSVHEPGSVLLIQHDTTRHVIVIWSGFTKVTSRVGSGADVVLAVRGPGDIVGELVGLTGGLRCATVVTLERVEALTVAADRFASFIGEFPQAGAVLTRLLVNRLRESDRERLAAGSMSVGQRLARLLLHLATRYGVPVDGGGSRIALTLSQKDLAACVGGSPRSVARELGRWRKRNIIANGRRWVDVRQPEALQWIAGARAPRP
jgi:CRP-like cAMP-binding protein